MPHSIRLRGPWHLEPLAQAIEHDDGSWELSPDSVPQPMTAEMPADWSATLGRDFRGLVRYTRQFHRPTGLEAISRVWLVIDDVDFQATVTLNDHPLGVIQLAGSPTVGQVFNLPDNPIRCPARFDITATLAPRNHLALDILLPPDGVSLPRTPRHGLPGGLIGLVRIEIE